MDTHAMAATERWAPPRLAPLRRPVGIALQHRQLMTQAQAVS